MEQKQILKNQQRAARHIRRAIELQSNDEGFGGFRSWFRKNVCKCSNTNTLVGNRKQWLGTPKLTENSETKIDREGNADFKLNTIYGNIIDLGVRKNIFYGGISDVIKVGFEEAGRIFNHDGSYQFKSFIQQTCRTCRKQKYYEVSNFKKFVTGYRHIGKELIHSCLEFLISIKFLKESDIIVLFAKPVLVDRDDITTADQKNSHDVANLIAYYKKLGFTQFKETKFMYASVKEILDSA